MITEPNKIYFLGNPYPNGHKVKNFVWNGRVDNNENIWFDFHLESENYYAEDESDDIEEPESNWNAKVLWKNYHNCKISSTYWKEKNKGIKIGSKTKKVNFNNCVQKELIANKLPFSKNFDYENLAFNIYLLGHDNCANHNIIFKKNKENFDIEWSGKIALTYSGKNLFDYSFIVNMQNIKFEGFYYPKFWTLKKAEKIFQRNIEDFENFKLIDYKADNGEKEYKLIRTEI
ncbi:MAG: hypothetical protein MUC49_06765 [Raineya sp.]|jgi:hypothetical protein|nr:hypothetical protein [Raineya sp.]